jgi:uncharacterized protein (DUF4415 family)
MNKLKLRRNSEEENRRINEGIAADPDTYELGDDFFRKAKPATRGKQKTPTKIRTSVRFSPEVIETYRGLGKGWQTRMDEDLKELLERKYLRVKKDGQTVTLER